MSVGPQYAYPDTPGIHKQLTDGLEPGAALTNAVASRCFVKLGGLDRFRLYFKSSVGGSLTLEYCHADVLNTSTFLTIGNPVAVTIVANVENKMDVALHYGERAARISFTPSAGPGTVTTAELCGVAPARR